MILSGTPQYTVYEIYVHVFRVKKLKSVWDSYARKCNL